MLQIYGTTMASLSHPKHDTYSFFAPFLSLKCKKYVFHLVGVKGPI